MARKTHLIRGFVVGTIERQFPTIKMENPNPIPVVIFVMYGPFHAVKDTEQGCCIIHRIQKMASLVLTIQEAFKSLQRFHADRRFAQNVSHV